MKKFLILCSLVFTMFVSGAIVNAAIPTEVTVSISSSVGNGNKNIVGTSQNKNVGDLLDLDATTLGGSNEFAYWVINGFVRAELGPTVQLRVQSKMSVLGIFHTTDEHAVLFVDSNGKLIDHVYVLDGETVSAPATAGYSKPGEMVVDNETPWKTLDGSETSLKGIDSSRIYVLQYKLPTTVLDILVIGGTVEIFTANKNDVVTVVAANKLTFTHWADEDGNVLSYNSTYSFTALEDVMIEAKSNEVTPVSFVSIKDLTGIRLGHESYAGRFELHGVHEIIEYGFIMSSTETGAITVDSTGVQFAKSNTYNPVTNEFLMSFPLVKFLSIRAYALIDTGDALTYIYNELPGSFASDLFISEYIEGTGNNKAIEIYNGTGKTVDLSSYSISLYSNGSTTGLTRNLEGTLAHGEVLVISNSQANPAILAVSDYKTVYNANEFGANWTGNDAVALAKDGVNIDVFGIIGNDPGTAWTWDGGSTIDKTLVRKSTVLSPTITWDSLEWDVYQNDTTEYLGSHEMEGSSIILSDSQSILIDAINLNEFDPIKYNGTITLPTTGDNGTTISWSSNSLDIINPQTNVVELPAGQPVTVILTATISKGGVSKSVTRSVVVGLTYEERVAADKEDLELESLTINEAGPIELPSEGSVHGSVISWASNNTDIITNDGIVTLPTSGSVDVILTATISYGATDPYSETKEFTVKVSSEALEVTPLLVSDFGTTNDTNTNYANYFEDSVVNLGGGTSTYYRAGGNYNASSWDYIALGQKNVAARLGDLVSNSKPKQSVDSSDPNVMLATGFKLKNVKSIVISMPMLKDDTTIHLQSSTDGTNWNAVTSITPPAISSKTDVSFLDLNVSGEVYYRIVFVNASSTSKNAWLGQIKTITFNGINPN